ncbi:DUF5047 domain-containing protein [Amycolatopsis thailandensis]|uniref:DUF5047 domain-containing protein n=1 Tax=Amycolatopsis thailandensis TaxID=589330 RepID=UPI0037984157
MCWTSWATRPTSSPGDGMRNVPSRYLKAVRGSHGFDARARVLTTPGLSGTNPGPLLPSGRPQFEIPVTDGNVKSDATAEVRSSLDLTTTYEFPTDSSGLLTPYGNELYVERGLVYGDGTTQWVGLGYFRMDDVDQDEAPDGVVQIMAKDRMAGIIDAKPLAPMQFAPGTSVSSMFSTLVGEVYPGATIQYDFDAATTTFPDAHVMDDSRYGFLKEICDSLGKVMYWDYQGYLQVKSAPSLNTPVFDVTHGDGGVLTKASRSLSREGMFNAVVAKGEAPGEKAPVRYVAYDMNPKSPTYWNGPFGKVPTEISSTMITTTDQARAAAYAKLERVIGMPYEVNFSMVPNAALEPLDPVRVSYSDEVMEIHVIDSLTIPLTADGVMTGLTRELIYGGAG